MVAVAVQSEQKVDEAQVQAAFGVHAHHGSADDSVGELSLPVTTAAAVAAAVAVPSDAASLQALAQQQDEYQRKLKQLQQQHKLQQQQWQMRQQAALQQQKMQLEQVERQDRMQHIQQKLHERIQLKKLHGSSGSPSPVASPGVAAGQTQATQQLRQAIIHREEKEMTQSLAEQQMQLYKAMMRDLEMQSGIPMTPIPSPAIPGGTGGFGAELIPAPIIPGTTALDATATKAYKDFQRARQEQQLRLQQYQQIQHAAATGGGGGSPSVVRTQAVPVSNDLVRQQMMIEQERLRVLQAQEMHQQQQPKQHQQQPQVSAQEQLLIQQHDILRQQQILQTLLQRQQLERQQQQTAAARSQQPQQQQQQKVSAAKKTSATSSTSASSSGEGVLPPPPAKKRKKAATSPESQMEALVRELIRLSNAGNAIEVRTSLDKMTAWVHRSFDAELLKFAQRDFRDIVLAKRPALMQANQWTSDIQVKCEYIIEKIAQVIMAVSVQHPGKATEGATPTTSSTDQANAIRLAAKEHAYAALKAQMMQHQKGKGGGAAAAKGSAQAASTTSSSAATASEEKKKQPLLVDLSLINPKQKAAALSVSAQPKSEASTSAEGAGQTSGATIKATLTTTPSAVPASTKATPVAPKNAASSTPLPSAPTAAAPLSPQLVQQLYEVDLTSRSCAVNEEEGEDKLYIPVKSIAKVMRRALPDDHGLSSSQMRAKSGGKKSSSSAETADVVVKTEDTSTTIQEAEEAKEVKHNDGDEEMKTGGDDEEESKPSTSSTPVASISLAALALQKRQELVERNLQQSGQTPIKIDDDAVAFMQECVTEFILYLTSEAKDHWSIDKKKTNSLLGTHVVQGMDNLGLSTYARVLDTFNAKIKRVQDAQTQKRVEKKLQEKKLKQQQKLLEVAEAKARAAAAKAAVDATATAGAGLGGGAEAQTAAGSVATTTDAAAASEASAATTTTTVTTTSSATQQELELMAREDLSTAQ